MDERLRLGSRAVSPLREEVGILGRFPDARFFSTKWPCCVAKDQWPSELGAPIGYATSAYTSTRSYDERVRKSIHTTQNQRLLSLLCKLRTDAGLTQADLAARIHKDQTFVSKYETRERRLDVLELREICTAVGVSLSVRSTVGCFRAE